MMHTPLIKYIFVLTPIVLLLIFPNSSMCQTQTDSICEDTLFILPADTLVQKKQNSLPHFSYTNVKEYIFKTLSYPSEAMKKNIEGTVYINFSVETNGKVSNIHITESVHPLLDAEALRLIRNMPLWQPFKLRDSTRLTYNIPIIFNIK